MNVQASESMNEAWVSLQGHVINGAFPLHRFINGSEHTGVFLAESRRHKLAQVAVKLVRAVPARADAQLARWLTADGLAHPHLVRIYEAGRCQLGGLQYLYAVMEYADQNLAELLDHRALTEDEAREMLAPTLSALAFLHARKYVQAQLKPSNVLVVGDQLKLASDTIRRAGESLDTDKPMTVYDPPESRGGSYWPAGDVWALGVSLCEALTRNRPVGLHDGGRPVAFPRDFPAGFREIVGRCLSRRPHDRPSVADVDAWLRGNEVGPATAATPAKGAAPETVKPPTREVPAAAHGGSARQAIAVTSAASAHAATDSASTPATRDALSSASKVGTIEVSEAALYTPSRDATAVGTVPTGAKGNVPGAANAAGAASTSGAATALGAASTSGAANTLGAAALASATTKGATAAAAGAATKGGTATTATSATAAIQVSTAATASAAGSQPPATPSQAPVMTATAGQRAKPASKRRTLVVTLAGAAALALIWGGARMLRTHQSELAPPTADIVDDADVAASASPQPQANEPSLAAPNEPAVPFASSTSQPNPVANTTSNTDLNDTPAEPEPDASAGAVNEVMPDVPRRARQTIRGHVKVSVRLIIDQDGSVFAALVDDVGPSKYFSRLAIDAAKKWTFAPVNTDGQRFVQVRFDFTRDGTTARAIPLK